jgi:hypothetical protein
MPFDRQPTLSGELVTVRPLLPNDFDALYAVAADPLVWAQHPEPDRWREDIFRTYFDDHLASLTSRVERSSGSLGTTTSTSARAKSRSAGRSLPAPAGAAVTTPT